ncbi:hypothetical protein WG907_04340 [Sphingobium sp. AN558]|uniref:hypothetical protein n=1 Tax=Sphingobium sp. AN558 TaxID=3133442 RepID=UPI0030C59DE4
MRGETFLIDNLKIGPTRHYPRLDLAPNIFCLTSGNVDLDARSFVGQDVAACRDMPFGIFSATQLNDLLAFVSDGASYRSAPERRSPIKDDLALLGCKRRRRSGTCDEQCQ